MTPHEKQRSCSGADPMTEFYQAGAPSLLAVGIRATRAKVGKGRRVWTIARVAEAGGAA